MQDDLKMQDSYDFAYMFRAANAAVTPALIEAPAHKKGGFLAFHRADAEGINASVWVSGHGGGNHTKNGYGEIVLTLPYASSVEIIDGDKKIEVPFGASLDREIRILVHGDWEQDALAEMLNDIAVQRKPFLEAYEDRFNEKCAAQVCEILEAEDGI